MSDYKAVLSEIITTITYSPSNPVFAAYVIQRARVLLGRRNIEEIECIDDKIHWVIDDFTSILKQQHGGNIRRYLESELKANNDFDLLKHCLNNYDYSKSETFQTHTMCDYFAVFALRHIAIAIELFSTVLPKDTPNHIKYAYSHDRLSEAHTLVYMALDSIGYAEHLKHSEKLIIENKELKNENIQLKASKDIEIKKAVKKEISRTKSIAAIKSHAKDYAAKERIYEWLSDVLRTDSNYLNKHSADKIARLLDKAEVVFLSPRKISEHVSSYKNELKKVS